MAAWENIQVDFSGGEVSSRMYMRADTEMFAKSALQMENFQPTLQGTVERSPGTRFVHDLDFATPNMRIIPYLTPANERGLVEITSSGLKLFPNILRELIDDGADTGPPVGGIVPIREQIVPNHDIIGGPDPWVMDPEWYPAGGERPAGAEWREEDGGKIMLQARWWKAIDPHTVTVTNEAEITFATDIVTISFDFEYVDNDMLQDGGDYTAFIRVGSTEGASDVMNYEFTGEIGKRATRVFNESLPTGAWTGTLYATIEVNAVAPDDGEHSSPLFALYRLSMFSDNEVDINGTAVWGTVPYTFDEIRELQYVQSPYAGSAGTVPAFIAPSKQLVITHPNHPPMQLYFNTDVDKLDPADGVTPVPVGYAFIEMDFGSQTPINWTNGYPLACASFNGRLILGGSQGKPIPGQATSVSTETVWGTEVGLWETFTDPDADPGVIPSDSIEFTTIYRSPIQWLYGQKQLLIGALEMEYTASADGIFQPADIGVSMQHTHGSVAVQPVGFGETVLFPADAGTRVRAMNYQEDDQGWVAPDLTLFHPELCASGIRRMVRMRNPHQMCVVLLNNGTLAILHQDSYANVMGWSRIKYNGAPIKDICVVTTEEGEDVLFCTVWRVIAGTRALYLEAITDWAVNKVWAYVQSNKRYNFDVATNVLPRLEHIEGKRVLVIGDGEYLGAFIVTSGVVTLLDDLGQAINVVAAIVGLPMESRFMSLPVLGTDPSAMKRFSQLTVKTRGSIRPRIVVTGSGDDWQRFADRDPATPLNVTQKTDNVFDNEIMNMGWDKHQIVHIREQIPLRVEILGIYGKIQGNAL
jgi:hypothetical protein